MNKSNPAIDQNVNEISEQLKQNTSVEDMQKQMMAAKMQRKAESLAATPKSGNFFRVKNRSYKGNEAKRIGKFGKMIAQMAAKQDADEVAKSVSASNIGPEQGV
jgi:replicative superfamily II helicase